MKAIAVYPGKPNSMHLEDIPIPKITDIPDGQRRTGEGAASGC